MATKTQTAVRYEVVQTRDVMDEWRVEGIDHDADGVTNIAVQQPLGHEGGLPLARGRQEPGAGRRSDQDRDARHAGITVGAAPAALRASRRLQVNR